MPRTCPTSSSNGTLVNLHTDGTATFAVRLAGRAWTSAARLKSYSARAQTSHTFDVRALDAYGNTSSATSRTWDVDATPPTVSITSPTNGANVNGTATITSNANDTGGSGLDTVTYEY